MLLLTALCAPSVAAQVRGINGRALDEVRSSPVSGALVRLLSSEGEERARVVSDGEGRFLLEPSRPGSYYVEATRLGYQRFLTPLLAFPSGSGSVPLDFAMTPLPVGLEGLSVEVDVVARAQDELKLSGVDYRDLGNRWIDRKAIEAVQIKRDVGTVLEWNNIPGVRIVRPENEVPGSDPLGLCVSLARARRGPNATCALIVVDGVRYTGVQGLGIDPEAVESMALLNPIEARILYGAAGRNGVLLVWLRRARR